MGRSSIGLRIASYTDYNQLTTDYNQLTTTQVRLVQLAIYVYDGVRDTCSREDTHQREQTPTVGSHHSSLNLPLTGRMGVFGI